MQIITNDSSLHTVVQAHATVIAHSKDFGSRGGIMLTTPGYDLPLDFVEVIPPGNGAHNMFTFGHTYSDLTNLARYAVVQHLRASVAESDAKLATLEFNQLYIYKLEPGKVGAILAAVSVDSDESEHCQPYAFWKDNQKGDSSVIWLGAHRSWLEDASDVARKFVEFGDVLSATRPIPSYMADFYSASKSGAPGTTFRVLEGSIGHLPFNNR